MHSRAGREFANAWKATSSTTIIADAMNIGAEYNRAMHVHALAEAELRSLQAYHRGLGDTRGGPHFHQWRHWRNISHVYDLTAVVDGYTGSSAQQSGG